MPIPYRLAFPLKAMQPPGLWGISPHFYGLYPCRGQVAYVLLTSAPVADRRIATPSLPLDLHVLSLSLAFILSQDQTLRCMTLFLFLFQGLPRHRGGPPPNLLSPASPPRRAGRRWCCPSCQCASLPEARPPAPEGGDFVSESGCKVKGTFCFCKGRASLFPLEGRGLKRVRSECQDVERIVKR